MEKGVDLLRAASRVLGGPRALAGRLGIGGSLLARLLTGRRRVPDALVLKAIDILEEQRRPSGSEINFQPRKKKNSSVRGAPRAPIESRDGDGSAAEPEGTE
jgi:hypothetical protein